jgi:hypothetical protein
MPKIFISYRRDDSEHVTGRIYDRLAAPMGTSSAISRGLGPHVGGCWPVDLLLGLS